MKLGVITDGISQDFEHALIGGLDIAHLRPGFGGELLGGFLGALGKLL